MPPRLLHLLLLGWSEFSVYLLLSTSLIGKLRSGKVNDQLYENFQDMFSGPFRRELPGYSFELGLFLLMYWDLKMSDLKKSLKNQVQDFQNPI